MKIQPTYSVVLIRVDEPEVKTDDGIYIQEEWKELPPTGTVTHTGLGVEICKPGDKVFFERFSAIRTPFGDDIRAVRQNAILAVYSDEKG